MAEEEKQTAVLENVLGEVKKLNTNVTKSEEGKTTGLAFGSAQISDDVQNLDDNLNDSVEKVGAQLKNNADEAQGNESQETEDKRDQMNIFKKMFSGISNLGVSLGKLGEGIFNVAKGGAQSLFNTVLPLLLPAIFSMLNSDFWKKTGEVVDQITEALKSFYNNILLPIFTSLKEGFFKQMENVGELFDGIGEAIQLFKEGDILGGIKKVISSIGTFLLKSLDNLVTTVYNAIAGIFGFEQTDSVGMSILNFFKNTYESIKTTVKETYENVKSFFTDTFQKVKTFFTETYDSAIASFKQTYEDVKKFFTEMFTFVDEGLSDFALFNFIKQTINDVIAPIKKIFSGDFTMDDLLDGAFAFLDIVYAPVNLAVNFIKDIFKFGDPKKPFKFSDFLFGPEGVFTKVVDFFKGLLDIDINKVVRGIPGAEKVLKALGIIEKSDEEKLAEKQQKIKDLQAQIDTGSLLTVGFSDKDEREELAQLQKELDEMKAKQQTQTEASQKASTLTVDKKLLEAQQQKQSGTSIVDGSTDARSFSSSSTTVVQERVTDPTALRMGLVNG
tara:strand:- start:837 stop:2507 length:1671 start_codon:yes stop_codon:yes gene_type:complete